MTRSESVASSWGHSPSASELPPLTDLCVRAADRSTVSLQLQARSSSAAASVDGRPRWWESSLLSPSDSKTLKEAPCLAPRTLDLRPGSSGPRRHRSQREQARAIRTLPALITLDAASLSPAARIMLCLDGQRASAK